MIRRLLTLLAGHRCPLCRRWQTDLARHQLDHHGNQLAQWEAMNR